MISTKEGEFNWTPGWSEHICLFFFMRDVVQLECPNEKWSRRWGNGRLRHRREVERSAQCRHQMTKKGSKDLRCDQVSGAVESSYDAWESRSRTKVKIWVGGFSCNIESIFCSFIPHVYQAPTLCQILCYTLMIHEKWQILKYFSKYCIILFKKYIWSLPSLALESCGWKQW